MTSRRRFLLASTTLAVPALAGCGTPLPLSRAPQGSDAAARRLQDSAEVHGLAAYRALADINIAYAGQWRPFIDRIQPEVVDAGFRGPSEERLMPRLGINAQAYRGPRGTKQVWWRRGEGTPERPGEVAVWFNGRPSTDRGPLTGAALGAWAAEGKSLTAIDD